MKMLRWIMMGPLAALILGVVAVPTVAAVDWYAALNGVTESAGPLTWLIICLAWGGGAFYAVFQASALAPECHSAAAKALATVLSLMMLGYLVYAVAVVKQPFADPQQVGLVVGVLGAALGAWTRGRFPVTKDEPLTTEPAPNE